MPLKTHVAVPGSTNSERLTARPAREGFVIICACTELVEADIDAVCVERGRPKWPITKSTDANRQRNQHTEKTKNAPYTPRMTRYEETFFPSENQEKKGFARFIINIGN